MPRTEKAVMKFTKNSRRSCRPSSLASRETALKNGRTGWKAPLRKTEVLVSRYLSSLNRKQSFDFFLLLSTKEELVDSTFDCKTQQNATLTGQEEERDVLLKVS